MAEVQAAALGAPRRSQIVLASLRSDRPTADYCSARSRASSASAGCGDGATSAEEALALAIETVRLNLQIVTDENFADRALSCQCK